MHHALPSAYSLPIGAKLDQWPLGNKDCIRFLTKSKISCSVWAKFCMVPMSCVRVHSQALGKLVTSFCRFFVKFNNIIKPYKINRFF